MQKNVKPNKNASKYLQTTQKTIVYYRLDWTKSQNDETTENCKKKKPGDG